MMILESYLSLCTFFDVYLYLYFLAYFWKVCQFRQLTKKKKKTKKEKENPIQTTFPIILIYNGIELYLDNSHFILFQFIQKPNEINQYL